ncbi:hypothetical protein SAY87_002907 [Trapa incisa]|uniref:Uncharacterized protein n=1 Tax=Trapa incisa TaxID=236973 RepID=A0AAN7KPH5_9MYRT|nr:hypothetical protein SAY87_002907 [Trapa incisa]
MACVKLQCFVLLLPPLTFKYVGGTLKKKGNVSLSKKIIFDSALNLNINQVNCSISPSSTHFMIKPHYEIHDQTAIDDVSYCNTSGIETIPYMHNVSLFMILKL